MATETLLIDLHVEFIQNLDTKRNDLAYYFTEHLRMNGIYWGLTALALMGHQDALPKDAVIEWVMSCWDESVGARLRNRAGTLNERDDQSELPCGLQEALHHIRDMTLTSIRH
ncbi:hypothetical protein P7C70_g7509, partial [Phenoliferia sp. Uapishka_3]